MHVARSILCRFFKSVYAGRRSGCRYPVLLCLALVFCASSAFAGPLVLLSAPQGVEGSDQLPQQLAKWRQQGLVSDAMLLRSDQAATAAFEALGVLEFHNEEALRRWQRIAQPQVGEGVDVIVTDAIAHAEKTPRNSADSVFVVAQYDVGNSQAEFQRYVDGYQLPDMKARIAERLINRYTNFWAREESNAPWQSLLIMEYRDPHSYAISEEVKERIGERLAAADPVYREFQNAKEGLRNKTASTEALWVELPPPDLSELPAYEPDERLHGSLRIVGSELKNAVDLLAKGFTFFHPDVKVSTSHIPSSEGGIAGLYMGVSDVAPMGDDAKITDLMPFYNTFGYLPTEISVATGGYEKRGSLFAWAIVVHKDNPLDSISFEQLKRIFGEQRTGGWEISDNNYKFTSKHALQKSDLIRTWGELGLGGDFANEEIQTFGYAAPGFAIAIERNWFHWSKKWNANFREYVEEKQTVPDEYGTAVASERPLEDLENNRYAMGISALMHVKNHPHVKVLAVSPSDGAEPVELTPENVATRRYPLIRDAFFYVNKPPDQPLNPIVREFMRYCLSREGQESIVKAGYYYPLSREYLLEQRAKLD